MFKKALVFDEVTNDLYTLRYIDVVKNEVCVVNSDNEDVVFDIEKHGMENLTIYEEVLRVGREPYYEGDVFKYLNNKKFIVVGAVDSDENNINTSVLRTKQVDDNYNIIENSGIWHIEENTLNGGELVLLGNVAWLKSLNKDKENDLDFNIKLGEIDGQYYYICNKKESSVIDIIKAVFIGSNLLKDEYDRITISHEQYFNREGIAGRINFLDENEFRRGVMSLLEEEENISLKISDIGDMEDITMEFKVVNYEFGVADYDYDSDEDDNELYDEQFGHIERDTGFNKATEWTSNPLDFESEIDYEIEEQDTDDEDTYEDIDEDDSLSQVDFASSSEDYILVDTEFGKAYIRKEEISDLVNEKMYGFKKEDKSLAKELADYIDEEAYVSKKYREKKEVEKETENYSCGNENCCGNKFNCNRCDKCGKEVDNGCSCADFSSLWD